MSVLAINDDDNGNTLLVISNRAGAQKIAKLGKDEMRSIESGEYLPFKNCGLITDARLQLIELPQIEHMTWREDLKPTWTKLNTKK